MSILKKIAYLEQLAKISSKDEKYAPPKEKNCRATKGWRRQKSFWTIMKSLKPTEIFYYHEIDKKYYIQDTITNRKEAVWYTKSDHDYNKL